ncbi:hypothetical protein CGQ25_11480 [Sinomonas sp. R1AF57]|nr:hypothetical protein CGQ25_11480 [Sinomonas sp. R1AF57]
MLLLGRARFHELGMRGRVILSQIPLNLTMLLVCLVAAVAGPEELGDPRFVAGQGMALALFAACVALPWAKLPYGLFLVIPFLDFVPIGFVASSASDTLSGLGLLGVFPVMWIAGSGFRPRIFVPLAGAAALLTIWAPVLLSGAATPHSLVARVVGPFILLAIGVGTSVMTLSAMAQQARVQELLERTETREQLLDTVLETADVGILVLDGEGKGMLANERHAEVYSAATPAEGAPLDAEPGMLAYREGPDGTVRWEERGLERVLSGTHVESELYRLGKGPGARVVSISARSFHNHAGRLGGTVVATSDVTDVVSAVRARDRFLSTMSHEFRTPLGNILGYAEMVLEDSGLSDSSRSDLEVIVRNANHVNQMVEDILAASVTGEDASAIRLPVDLAELVRAASDSSRAEASRKGISLTATASAVLPVLADRTGLVRVLDNLVSNALKYSASGTAVRLTALREGPWAVCRVEDAGIGIAADEMEHVFTRFGRSSAALDSEVPGTGLGLALAKEVVEQHGGTIECTSRVGVGSTFTVRLPLRSEGPGSNPPRRPAAEHGQHA